MECPECNQEHPLLPGAKFCPMCGHELPPGRPEPLQLTCSSCGRPALPEAKFCDQCGETLGEDGEHQHDEEQDFSKRTACSDGNCIGIIGPDGKCTECGKPYGAAAEDEEEKEEEEPSPPEPVDSV